MGGNVGKPTSLGGQGATQLCTWDKSKDNFDTHIKPINGGPNHVVWEGNETKVDPKTKKRGVQVGVWRSAGTCNYAAIGKNTIPLKAKNEIDARTEAQNLLLGNRLIPLPLRTKAQTEADIERARNETQKNPGIKLPKK